MPFWLFALNHEQLYSGIIERWNHEHANPAEHISPLVISVPALERRLLSGFLSNTAVPDLTEVESIMASRFFSGPLDAVGFADLTDILQREGLMSQINPPSFSPWTTRGHIFGLPHDVHPVLLAYRSDIVEAAGIDVNRIETWDDFVRIMRPLMPVNPRTGYPDRYLVSVWETSVYAIDILLLQAGSGFFDEAGKPAMNSPANVKVISTIISWVSGPNRIATNAPPFDAEGNQKFLDGYVLCNLMPDWMAGLWMKDLPGLAGKVKLMPIPAWEKGGRRTSVQGGTMIAFPKRSKNFEQSWEFAKRLYLSPELAVGLYNRTGIISPVRANWTNPVYDAPNPYFAGQANGRLYINAAPDVPNRPSSPYKVIALTRMIEAATKLKRIAEERGIFDPAQLAPLVKSELDDAQTYMEQKMSANAFLESDQPAAPNK
jgi:arabinosaccharide transport system substrate-binding protein